MMRRFAPFVVLLSCIFVVGGCDGRGLSNREGGALSGAALGAGLGAIIGHSVGKTGAGIAIGSGIGALSGGLVGNALDNSEQRNQDTQRRISEQDKQLEENRRLIQELRSRGADARSTERGVVVNLPDVLFEFDSARLTSEAERTAREIADVSKGVEGRRLSVEGHTDSVGTYSYNQRLSEDRSRSVADALTDNGIPRSRISTRGFGESSPIASNQSASGRQRNRRVEVIIENR